MDRWWGVHTVIIKDMVKERVEDGESSSMMTPNELYGYVHLYLGTLLEDATAVAAEWPKTKKSSTLYLAPRNFIIDIKFIPGVKLQWYYSVKEDKKNMGVDKRLYELVLPKQHKYRIKDYLHHIEGCGKKLQLEQQKQRLYSNYKVYRRSDWHVSTFSPTATFETVAMDPDTKKLVMDDIKQFMNGKDYYTSIGRPWKRGYLLYGPPGTGKSSLIGAMANFTGYDVFNVELGCVEDNTGLMRLLWKIGDKAIIVIEDIDCCMKDRKKKQNTWSSSSKEGITLSGLLNFTDGIQSSCGSERIFVFTTNYVDRLDEALVRPGRMDMHICLSYCTFPIFEDIARIYLKSLDHGETCHCYYPRIKELLSQVEVTPARVGFVTRMIHS